MTSINYDVVGVLSDTHLADIKDCAELASSLISGPFRNVDAIFHAGDHTSAELGACFHPIPMLSVRGNMDHQLSQLPQYRIIRIKSFNVGIVHGWGSAEGLEKRILSLFAGQSIDVIVYGHSHFPVCHMVDGVLLFNPGSPTDRRRAPQYTVGILEFGETVTGYHLEYNNK